MLDLSVSRREYPYAFQSVQSVKPINSKQSEVSVGLFYSILNSCPLLHWLKLRNRTEIEINAYSHGLDKQHESNTSPFANNIPKSNSIVHINLLYLDITGCEQLTMVTHDELRQSLTQTCPSLTTIEPLDQSPQYIQVQQIVDHFEYLQKYAAVIQASKL